MLRPTPGDPWGVEQHHWNTGAEENQQLNPGGPSNRQKSSGPNQPFGVTWAMCRALQSDHSHFMFNIRLIFKKYLCFKVYLDQS